MAGHHYYPVKGSWLTAHSLRDLSRLLFNAAKLGKSTKKYEDKIADILGKCSTPVDILFIEIIKMIARTKSGEENKNFPIIGLVMSNKRRKLPISDEEISDYYYNIVATIRGNSKLPHKLLLPGDIFKYAVLFDNIEIVTTLLQHPLPSNSITTIGALGSSDIVQYVYDHYNHPFMGKIYSILWEAIFHINTDIIPKLVQLGAKISYYTIKGAIDMDNREILTQLIKFSTHKIDILSLNNWLYRAGNSIIAGELFIELGADVNFGLLGAVAGDYPNQVTHWINRGATNLNNALILAVERDSEKVIKLLIGAGADNINQALDTIIDRVEERDIFEDLEKLTDLLIETGKVDIDAALDKLIGVAGNGVYTSEHSRVVNMLTLMKRK